MPGALSQPPAPRPMAVAARAIASGFKPRLPPKPAGGSGPRRAHRPKSDSLSRRLKHLAWHMGLHYLFPALPALPVARAGRQTVDQFNIQVKLLS